MQQIYTHPNPTQLYQQALPAFSSPIAQPSNSSYSASPSGSLAAPIYNSAQQIVQPSTQQGVVIPSSDIATNNLTTSKGLMVGLKNGAIFSLLACLPVWGIEKAFKEDNHVLHFAKEMKTYTQKFDPSSTKWATRVKTLEKPMNNFLTSAGLTGMIGITTAALLGPWMVSHTRKRIIEINQVQAEQQQGTFQTKPLTLFQKLGITEKPVTQPDSDYQHMLATNLNNEQAFKQGAISVFIAKLGPLCITLPFWLSVLGLAKLGLSKETFEKLLEQSRLKQTARLLIKPVFIIKTAALPVIGGFIALQTVPWMRKQLGIDNSGNAISQPNPASTPAA